MWELSRGLDFVPSDLDQTSTTAHPFETTLFFLSASFETFKLEKYELINK